MFASQGRNPAARPETVRRWLHKGDLVYRRPRPVLGPKDPDRQAKLDALRGLLAGLPADEEVQPGLQPDRARVVESA